MIKYHEKIYNFNINKNSTAKKHNTIICYTFVNRQLYFLRFILRILYFITLIPIHLYCYSIIQIALQKKLKMTSEHALILLLSL